MSTDENKPIVRRLFDAIFDERRLDRADGLFAPDYPDHGALRGQAHWLGLIIRALVSGLSSPHLRNMLLAVFAPFVAIALLATPLAFDALRHTLRL